MKTSKTRTMRATAAGLVVAVIGTSGCDLLEVTNAGLIEDESLNDPSFAAALVAGMSADYSRAWNAGGTQRSPVMAFELSSGLSDRGEHVIGFLDHDIVDRQGTWDAWQRARWVASAGVVRLKESLGANYDKSPDAARANLWAGFSNRLLGESVCNAVIDGGEAQPRAVHFQLAEAYFTEAARIALAAGTGAAAQETYLAALGGRASVRAWQGNWTGAVADASLVPASFVFLAQFATAGVQNGFFSEQFQQRYLTVMASPWENVVNDPRVPWSKTAILEGGVAAPTRGGGYRTWPQMKFQTRDSDIPITHGAEMLVLRAEAALRANDIAGMTSLLNQARARFSMAPVAQPASTAAAWDLLKFERGATLWLEHRAFWDAARWYAEGRDTRLEGRAKCYPIGKREIDSNPNLIEFRDL